MKQIDTEELKAVQLEILDVVIKFCDEHNINYWLDYGTLIGAVRHKGYIPWDDDIDLGMLRPDYDKFMNLFNKENTRYKFYCIENNSSAPSMFGKVFDTDTYLIRYYPRSRDVNEKVKLIKSLGIDIDIWCHDNVPDDDRLLEEMYRRKNMLYHLNSCATSKIFHDDFVDRKPRGSLPRRICVYAFRMFMHSIAFFLPKNYFLRKIARSYGRYKSTNTRRVGDFFTPWRATIDRKALETYIYADFEGRRCKIPAGYDEWLTKVYGDYMQLPPEEERKTHHYFIAFVKD